MIDHTSAAVSDIKRSITFYEQALKPIGYTLLRHYTAAETGNVEVAGFGENGKPDFWIAPGEVGTPLHIAFGVASRALVDAFYQAALAAGGKDNGAPGLRPMYHPDYYGAFVRDPDGHNIEAVCHAKQ